MQAISTIGAAPGTPREEQEQFDRQFARTEGFRAGRNGLAIGLNPYHPDDQLYEDWRSSWHQGAAEAAHRAVLERTREPQFVQKWDGQAPGEPVKLSTLVAANSDDDELCDWARRAMVDACFMTGGGAAPACWLRRVA